LEFVNLHDLDYWLDDFRVRRPNLSSYEHEAKLISNLGNNGDSTNANRDMESGSINLVYYTISIYT
jgi:hypothetical protein